MINCMQAAPVRQRPIPARVSLQERKSRMHVFQTTRIRHNEDSGTEDIAPARKGQSRLSARNFKITRKVCVPVSLIGNQTTAGSQDLSRRET
jgi:hypothetical protein